MHLGDLVINVALDHRASLSFGHYEIVMFVWKKICQYLLLGMEWWNASVMNLRPFSLVP